MKKLVLGISKYPTRRKKDGTITSGPTKMPNGEYPFDVAAFIPNPLGKDSNECFRRVMGMIFGKVEAKRKIESWISNNTSPVDIALELKILGIILGNHEEHENFKNFSEDKKGWDVLLLGDEPVGDVHFFNPRFKNVFTYPHPSKQGGHTKFWSEFDYKYDDDDLSEKYSSSQDIMNNFTV